MKITLTKVVLVLGCLIVSDMMFNWGLPLGGLLFLLWLILARMNFLYLEDKCKTAGVKTFIGQKVSCMDLRLHCRDSHDMGVESSSYTIGRNHFGYRADETASYKGAAAFST